MSYVKTPKKYFFIIFLANLAILPLSTPNALAMEIQHHKITKEDLRKTKPGKTLTRLNKKYREMMEAASTVKPEPRAVLIESAKEIKSSDEYREAVAILKPIFNQPITCYGSMCGSSNWKRTAIEGMLVNRAASHCFWDKNGNDVCQSSRPRADQVYGEALPPNTGLPGTGGALCVCTDKKGRPYMPIAGNPCGVEPVWRDYDCQKDDREEVIMEIGPDGNLYVK